MASIRITLKRRTKGGPGSGNWGHSGRPGQVGGSNPRGHSMSIRTGADWKNRYEAKTGRPAADKTPAAPKKDPEQEKLQQYFDQNSATSSIHERLKMFRSEQKAAANDAWKYSDNAQRAEFYRNRSRDLQSKVDDMEKEWKDSKKKLSELAKGAKAPAYGEWKRVEGSTSKRVGGSSTEYHVPDRPELGKVELYRFGGWSMQRVAPHASVTYNNSSFEWHGQGAVQSARNFMNKIFGTGLY
jgi:hypothetical protein